MSAISPQQSASNSANPGGAASDWPTSWQTRESGVGVGRYTDPGFAALEFERLWSRVWQAGARVDEVPLPGDYTTYSIGDQSILVVRVDEDTIKVTVSSGSRSFDFDVTNVRPAE